MDNAEYGWLKQYLSKDKMESGMRCRFIVLELCHEINMYFSGATGPNKSSCSCMIDIAVQ